MEPVSQELICKAKAAEFLKEREHCNNNYAYYWARNYVGFALNTNTGKLEFMCWIRSTYSPTVTDYRGVMITENSDKSNTIIATLKTKWKGVKTEDENENDTIAALILGIYRLEGIDFINFKLNDSAIHEALVSPNNYDIGTRRSKRALILGMTKSSKPGLELIVTPKPETGYRINDAIDIRYIINECKDENHMYKIANLLKYK